MSLVVLPVDVEVGGVRRRLTLEDIIGPPGADGQPGPPGADGQPGPPGPQDISALVVLSPAASARNVIQPTVTNATALVIKAFAGQTANLQEWQTSGGVVGASIDALGNTTIRTGGARLGSASLSVTPPAATAEGLIIKAFSGQTVDPFQVQDSAGTVLVRVQSGGHLVTAAGANVVSGGGLSAGNGTVYTPSYSQNLVFNNAGLTVSRTGGTTPSLLARVIAKGVASQSADIFQTQDSAGSVLTSLRSDGGITALQFETSRGGMYRPSGQARRRHGSCWNLPRL
jgi:hypothetical protein